ncbi:MAG: biopolymer transporter ExbD [Marinibacterium sp.]|nr:biopolymer transporter ExbD [Marinibacterium sp.]
MIRTAPPGRGKAEPTIALINIVFLMLIFFLIAGTLAPPMDRDVALVSTRDLDGQEPPDTLVIRADGTLYLRGIELTSVEAFVDRLSDEDRSALRIVPDRDLPARTLIGHAREMRGLGAERILIVTERGLE